MLIIVLFGLMFIVAPISSQTLVSGLCDKPVQQSFELEKYLGVWYEIQRSLFFQETGATCVEAEYTSFGNGSIKVLNSQITQKGEYRSITGNANVKDPSSHEAKLLVNFPSVGRYNGTYWVMETDYTNYSIVWSCSPSGQDKSNQILWFLARERNPSEQVRRKVQTKMTDLGLLATLKLEATNQTECYLIV